MIEICSATSHVLRIISSFYYTHQSVKDESVTKSVFLVYSRRGKRLPFNLNDLLFTRVSSSKSSVFLSLGSLRRKAGFR